jgi:hypothetical protein
MNKGSAVPADNISMVIQYLIGSYRRKKIPVLVSVNPSSKLATRPMEKPVAMRSGMKLSGTDLVEM